MFPPFITALIASPFGRRLAVFAAVGLVLVSLVGWAKIERAWRHAAEDRAEAAEAAVAVRDRSIAALESAAAEAAANAERLKPVRRAIHAAPKTDACAASPAIRAVVEQLRQDASSVRAR